jgi:16S rRNA G966 N2-methylase RsmD/predicted RNA-binding Zn-ribbon protein involved in translation (DUF1610 family)
MKIGSFSQIGVTAETHPPGYSFHKYWARKPHNIVRIVLQACGLAPGDLVLDPFCGSGVPLSEAAALGATCIGFDVNPVAVELTRVTLNPPDPDLYRSAVSSIQEILENKYTSLFQVSGRTIRYAVHATVVECKSCGERISADVSPKRGRTYVCPKCSERLYFNLENAVATRQLKVVFDDGTEKVAEEEHNVRYVAKNSSPFDKELIHNNRILSFCGMHTRHLFTQRNFEVLSVLADQISLLPDNIRSAALLTLTASVAQCSRLIPYRNNLKTGGPAWTVPGFWVPPLHLETNPLTHIRARLQRTYSGLKHLQSMAGRSHKHSVQLGDSALLLSRQKSEKTRATVVFLDPPYGDSIPYLEFSAIWNSFLSSAPDPGLDIAVSNRSRGDGTWKNYENSLSRIILKLLPVMKKDGRIIVTFNNKDVRAWRAILSALQKAGFCCKGAFYQHPAVISAKAQLAQEGSYVGDIYCLFSHSTAAPNKNTSLISAAIQRVLLSHKETVFDDNALQRVALTEFIRANVAAEKLGSLQDIITKARNLCISKKTLKTPKELSG